MKGRIQLRIGNMLLITLLLVSVVYGQEINRVSGTIGDGKPGNNKIVICVYGSAACMPVVIDTNMTVKYNGLVTKLTQLPFGLYLEARISKDLQGQNRIDQLKIDMDKTVICFSKLKEGQDKELYAMLGRIKGVKSYKLNRKSNQVFIAFKHKVIDYKNLENKIKNAGFELE